MAFSTYDPKKCGALCDQCPLNGQPLVPPEEDVMSPMGRFTDVSVTIVGECPSTVEASQGRLFTGPAGTELDKALRMGGIKRGNCHVTNVVLCQPPGKDLKTFLQKLSKYNRTKAPNEPTVPSPIDCCKPRFEAEIKDHRNFITLGRTANYAVTGNGSSITAVRGALVELEETDRTPARKVMPTVPPGLVLHQMKYAHVFRNDIAKASRWFRGEAKYEEPEVLWHPKADELRQFLFKPGKTYAFDLETDGIDNLTTKIRCIGIGDSKVVAMVGLLGKDGFTKFYPREEELKVIQVLKDYFADESIAKIAHNGINFDAVVLYNQLGVRPKNIIDTMLLHKSVESELPHGLGYVVSLYAEAPAWKCYDSETEILTRNGWVRFDQLEKGVEVAQWNNSEISFVVPRAYVDQEYKGKIWKLTGSNVDLLVTPDHKMIFRSTEHTLNVCMIQDLPQIGQIPHVTSDFQTTWSELADTTREQVDYDGRIYCVSVPSGFVLVRRNGKVTVSGNTDREGNKLAAGSESDEQLHLYCAKDTQLTALVQPKLKEQTVLRGQADVCALDHKIQEVCAEMHMAGMYVDQKVRLDIEIKLLKRRQDLLNGIRERLGNDRFNPNSTDQMRDLLFGQWKLTPPLEEEDRFTSSGDPSTADLILRSLLTEELPEDQREIIKRIRYYRKVIKVLGTYVTKLRPSNVRVEDDLGWDDEDEDWIDRETRKKYGLEKTGIVNPQTGRMYPGYSVGTPVTGRLSSAKPINCFDAETELLTDKGWIRFDQLLEEHKQGVKHNVAQWDKKTEEITFAAPVAYHEGHHEGEMVRFITQSANLLMTPNHRLPLKKTSGKLIEITAEELLTLGHGNATIHSAISPGGPGLPLTDDEIRFLVAIQADGSYQNTGDVCYGLDVGFTKTRKATRFLQIIANIPYIRHSDYSTAGDYRYYLPWNDRLKKLMAYLGPEKLWDAWLLRLNNRQRKIFVDEIWEWDGCSTRKSQYASAIRQNVDWVQTLLIMSGVRANIRSYTNAEGHHVWIVDVRPTTVNAVTDKAERSKVPWSDMVYCVTTPKDTIVVRRNGRVTITHQSQNFPKSMRKMITAAPGNVLVGADMDQLELRIAAARWGIDMYLRAFAEGKDPHSMTAYAVFGEQFCKAAGIDPACFAGSGKLVGTDFDETGKFKGTGESKKLRDLSKAVAYASQYMAKVETVHKLIQKTEVENKDGTTDLPYSKLPLRQVREMHSNWLSGAPEYEIGWNREIDTYRRQGYLAEPITGRRRDFLDGEAPNEIVNFPVQSIAAGLMNVALLRLVSEIPFQKWGPGTGILNQCHDAIVIECPADGCSYTTDDKGKKHWNIPENSIPFKVARLLEECLRAEHPSLPGVVFTASADIEMSWDKV